MSKDTGGPAFPRPWSRSEGDCEYNNSQEGMTMRDYFAGQAMNGLLSRGMKTFKRMYRNGEGDGIVDISYEIADAMLADRKEST